MADQYIDTNWDAITKTIVNGNNGMETNEDNDTIPVGLVQMGNMFGMEFKVLDSDAITFKLEAGNKFEGADVGANNVANTNDTVSDALYLKSSDPSVKPKVTRNLPIPLTGDFDIQLSEDLISGLTPGDRHFFWGYKDSQNFFWFGFTWTAQVSIRAVVVSNNVAIINTSLTAGADRSIQFRLVRSGTTMSVYYDFAESETWTLFASAGSMFTDDMWTGFGSQGPTGGGTVEGSFRSFKMNSGAFATSGAYQTSGPILLTVDEGDAPLTTGVKAMGVTTFSYVDIDGNNYPTLIEWIVNGNVEATKQYVSGELPAAGVEVIVEDELTTGSFSNVIGPYFVRITPAGSGAASFDITKIEFDYLPTKVDQIMERLGLNDSSAYFASPDNTRDFIEKELLRAEAWLRLRVGYDIYTDTIPTDVKAMIDDAIFSRIAYWYYRRMASIRLDLAENFRLMAREAKMEYEANLVMIAKSSFYSKSVPYPDKHPMKTIKEE